MDHCALDLRAHPQNWSRVCKQQTQRKWPTLLSRYSCRDWTKLKANYRCDFPKGEKLLMACGYQSSEATVGRATVEKQGGSLGGQYSPGLCSFH